MVYTLNFGGAIAIISEAGQRDDRTMIINQYPLSNVRCYDGDTCRADVCLGFNVWLHNAAIRLEGINTPEIRGDSRIAGLAARDHLRGLIAGHPVRLRTAGKRGKYGRIIGRLHANGQDINAAMVQSGHAVAMQY